MLPKQYTSRPENATNTGWMTVAQRLSSPDIRGLPGGGSMTVRDAGLLKEPCTTP
ncbi:hypothetical protein ACME9W_18860 [Escherichia coli]|nr:hypothetical protein AB26_2607 [Escherichia coli 2-011-08_S1_C2]MCN8039613.1 hypothetical protein [Escherichia coli]